MNRDLYAFDALAAERHFRTVLRLTDVLVAATRLEARVARFSTAPVYVVSSLFLRDCYETLMRHASEDMFYITGPELAHTRVLERCVMFEKSARSAAGVAGEPQATHSVLIELETQGHRLTGWFHSHPGYGPEATRPSRTDLDHQGRLERGRCPAIGAIFTRDGYVRFFSREAPFALHIYGKGVQRTDERTYRLDPHEDPHRAAALR